MAVPAWVTDLQARRDNITTELAAINNTEANVQDRNLPGARPDLSGDGGGTAENAYVQRLHQELEWIEKRLANAAEQIRAEAAIDTAVTAPWELQVELD